MTRVQQTCPLDFIPSAHALSPVWAWPSIAVRTAGAKSFNASETVLDFQILSDKEDEKKSSDCRDEFLLSG